MADTGSSLLDEIRELHVGSKAITCTARQVLDALDEADRDALEVALADPSIKGTIITAALKRRGFEINAHTIQRHRRGGCTCD